MLNTIIQYLISPVLTAIVALVISNFKEKDAHLKARDKADVVLLRKMLKEYYDYYKDKDCIDEVDYQNFLEGYDAYHALGGNGMVTKMFDELSKKHISQ